MHFEQQSVLFADKSRTAHSQSARFSVHIFVLTRHRFRFWRFSNYCFALFVTMLTLARGHIPSHSWPCDGNAQSARTQRVKFWFWFVLSLAVVSSTKSMIIIRFGKQVGCCIDVFTTFSLSVARTRNYAYLTKVREARSKTASQLFTLTQQQTAPKHNCAPLFSMLSFRNE